MNKYLFYVLFLSLMLSCKEESPKSSTLIKEQQGFYLSEWGGAKSNLEEEKKYRYQGPSFCELLEGFTKGARNAYDLDLWFAKTSKELNLHFASNNEDSDCVDFMFSRLGTASHTIAALAASLDFIINKDNQVFKDLAYAEFYSKLLKLKNENPAISNGIDGGVLIKILDHEQIYAFKRRKGVAQVFGVFNLSEKRQSMTISERVEGRDIITGQDIIWKEQTALGLEPWQFYLISNK